MFLRFTRINTLYKVVYVEKENLNWRVPKPVADWFNETATEKFGAKGKWIAAVAAITAYAKLSDEEREEIDIMASMATHDIGVERIMKALTPDEPEGQPPMRIAAKAIRKKSGKKIPTKD